MGIKQTIMQPARGVVLVLLWVAACGKPSLEQAPEITEIAVKRAPTEIDLSKPEPFAEYWNDVAAGAITLMAQPMVAPRPETTTTEKVVVQAIHDQKFVAFRLRWKDPEKSEAGHLGEFSDAMALEFPVKEGALPPVMMGAPGMPVHLLHWRAQYQRDEEKGKPEMEDLYPNLSVDMYAHEFKEAPGGSKELARDYTAAKASGNPQAYRKKAVDEILAEGFGSSAVQPPSGAKARGEWKEGYWTLVIARPLAMQGRSALRVGGASNIAFAAWQGGKSEVGARKCVTMAWTPIKIE